MITHHFDRALHSMEEVDRLGVGRPELFDFDAVARELARIADLGVSIGRLAKRLPGPLHEDLARNVDESTEAARLVVEEATTAIIEGSGPGVANDLLDRCEESLEDVDALGRSLFDESAAGAEPATAEGRALTRALDDLTRTVESGEAIAEVALRAALRGDDA